MLLFSELRLIFELFWKMIVWELGNYVGVLLKVVRCCGLLLRVGSS